MLLPSRDLNLTSAEVIKRINGKRQLVHLWLTIQQPGADVLSLTQIALLIHLQSCPDVGAIPTFVFSTKCEGQGM